MLTPPPSSPPQVLVPSFDEEFETLQARELRTACFVAGPLLVAFGLLDYWIVPDAWGRTLLLRVMGAFSFLWLAALLERRRLTSTLVLSAVVTLVTVIIAVAALYSGGAQSPYVYSAMLPLAGAGLLVPLRLREAVLVCALVLAALYLPLLAFGGPGDSLTLAISASFLLCMSVLTVVGAAVRENDLRKEHKVRGLAASQAGLANLGMLAGGLAHELSNPLSVVRLLIEDLMMDGDGAQAGRQELELLDQATKRMQNVLSSMRSQTRLPRQRFVPVDLGAEIEAASRLMEARLRLREIDFVKEIGPAPAVEADPTLLGQILLNLLLNAADAAEDGPKPRRVRLRLGSDPEAAVVEVEDSGHGVPAGLREQIFAPLFTTKKEGTGIGLWLGAEIARAHGGSLSLHDGREGGALFRLRIPLPRARDAIADS